MKDEYGCFIETLTDKLIQASGFPRDRIRLVREESGEERLCVDIVEQDQLRGSCAIHVKELYEQYCSQTPLNLDFLVREVLKGIGQVTGEDLKKIGEILSTYESAREKLFIRLLNYDREKKELENAVFKRTGDIALVLYLQVCEKQDSMTSTKIPRNVVKNWGCEEDKVFREALVNTYFLSPPRAYSWEKMLEDYSYEGENFMDLLHPCALNASPCGNCISTRRKTNGAISIFLPGVAARLSDLLEDDLYLAFTSVHEVMVHSAHEADPRDLQVVLRNTIQESTPEEDFLTEKIYKYNREEESFVCLSNL